MPLIREKKGNLSINIADIFRNEAVQNRIIKEFKPKKYERRIWKLTLSLCCKKPIFSIKNTVGKGFFCTYCEKPVYSTIDRKYWNKISKEPKT